MTRFAFGAKCGRPRQTGFEQSTRSAGRPCAPARGAQRSRAPRSPMPRLQPAEEMPACQLAVDTSFQQLDPIRWIHCLVIASSRLKIRLAVAAYAASSPVRARRHYASPRPPAASPLPRGWLREILELRFQVSQKRAAVLAHRQAPDVDSAKRPGEAVFGLLPPSSSSARPASAPLRHRSRRSSG